MTWMEGNAGYRRTVEEVVAGLGSDAWRGLISEEARARLVRYGPNELEAEKTVPAWQRFLAQFRDTLVILLLVATAVSVGLWAYERDSALPYEGLAIFAIVLLNGILGYVQESRAERAVAALRAMSAAEASVVRDGERRSVPASELVPGDVILVEEGDTIPADARLVQSTALQASEASLTGESLPVQKDVRPIEEEVGLGDRSNMLFSGTAATYGRGRAVVTATGMQTELGRIAGMLRRAEDEATPLQKELDRTGKLLGAIVLVITAVIVATILLVEGVREPAAIFDVLILGVALAVAAVPEGLPAIVTAVLAIGVQRMARRNAIVRRLPAVETLGSATVIASDKTGTLTKNEMTVRTVVTASGRADLGGTGYAPEGELQRAGRTVNDEPLRAEVERALRAADLANNATLSHNDGRWSVQGDPTEGALIVAARKVGLAQEALDSRFERVGEVPFSSERKLMSTVHRDAEKPERLAAFAKGAPDVLLPRCSHEILGEEARPLTDERRAITGSELERLPDEDLEREVRESSVYARVNPEHKLRIVRALQKNGQVVAMTGDGVNDAPALKTADIGVAMGITGTDVSKEAADMVLTDDNFASIVAAVEEGRGIFANIRKFLRFLLSSNLGEVTTMFVGILLAERIGLRAGQD